MKKLYLKSPLAFAILWICIYVIGTSITHMLDSTLVLPNIITLAFHIITTAFLFVWLKTSELLKYYGISRPEISAKRLLFYIPLIAAVSCNLWFGVKLNAGITESVFLVLSMLCVGFLEEVIFRGFLFRAMEKDGLKSAVIVSSITFGIGHIINLLNGTGAPLETSLQIITAIGFGFLFVIIFIKTKSIIPCILAHSTINTLSVFANESGGAVAEIITSAVLLLLTVTYSLYIIKRVK
ncbi:MAG: CPBP family intramembrane metalloprotease [Clostridia bacterium]|nr:CPBP family intramembrane metalloprotease [Clostridia bacterium]